MKHTALQVCGSRECTCMCTHALCRPAPVKLLKELLTLAWRPSLPIPGILASRGIYLVAHTPGREQGGPSSSHCSLSFSVFEKNEQRTCLSIQNFFAFLPTPWLRSALPGIYLSLSGESGSLYSSPVHLFVKWRSESRALDPCPYSTSLPVIYTMSQMGSFPV